MKYIDADLLRKDIDNWNEAMIDAVGEYSDGIRFALKHFTFMIDSLQQEPIKKDEDAEKLIICDIMEATIARIKEGKVDKEKEECRGELPALGEYGWLQIARHFANWQKKKDRETIELAEEHAILAGRVQMKEEMMKEIEKDTLFLERAWLTLYNLGYEELAERLKTFKEKYANKM